MDKTFTHQTNGNALTVHLDPKGPATIGFAAFVAAFMYGFCAWGLYNVMIGPYEHSGILGAAVVGGMVVLFSRIYFFAARALLRKMTHQQTMLVNKATLTLTESDLFSKKTRTFDVNLIKDMGIAAPGNFTEHPLSSGPNDQTGFNAREAMIRSVIVDGTILLKYNEEQIKIGKGIPSWDAEEILMIVGNHIGRRFVEKVDIDFDEDE